MLARLREHDFRLVPEVFTNRRGETISVGPDGLCCTAFCCMPGRMIGSFDRLDAFNETRRMRFFREVGRMTRLLGEIDLPGGVPEMTLCDLSRGAADRLETILGRLDGDEQAARLAAPHAGALRSFAARAAHQYSAASFPEGGRRICHFDLHLGQVLFANDELTAILDWDWMREAEWYGVDWASSLALCCYRYDHSGGLTDGVYDAPQVRRALAELREGFGDAGRLPLAAEQRLLAATWSAYALAQFLFTAEHYLALPGDPARFVDLRHFMNMILRNDFERLAGL